MKMTNNLQKVIEPDSLKATTSKKIKKNKKNQELKAQLNTANGDEMVNMSNNTSGFQINTAQCHQQPL